MSNTTTADDSRTDTDLETGLALPDDLDTGPNAITITIDGMTETDVWKAIHESLATLFTSPPTEQRDAADRIMEAHRAIPVSADLGTDHGDGPCSPIYRLVIDIGGLSDADAQLAVDRLQDGLYSMDAGRFREGLAVLVGAASRSDAPTSIQLVSRFGFEENGTYLAV